jgi:hypothetical protein
MIFSQRPPRARRDSMRLSRIHLLVFTVLIAAARHLEAAQPADLVLTDGRTLKAARFIKIGESGAQVVHAGGAETVSLDFIPLDVLARAQMELEVRSAERQKKDSADQKRAAEKIAVNDAAKAEEIQLRLAAAAARERSEAVQQSPGTNPARIPTDAQLMALKAKFPGKRTETVAFSRDKRPMQTAASTTRTVDRTPTGHVSRATTAVNTRMGNNDTLTVEVPHADIWSDYKGWVHTATLQSLPATLAKLEAKIEADLQKLRGQSQSLNSQVNAAQARMTIEWINQTLRPYLAQLRALTGR